MSIKCVWEHKGEDSLLYSVDFPGAFTRAASKREAMEKMAAEIRSYAAWLSLDVPLTAEVEIQQDAACDLNVKDADSDVLFERERGPLSLEEYLDLKSRALKSAEDFLTLYRAIPDKNQSLRPDRASFYGPVPRTAEEMYRHTKNVNEYYFNEIGIEADNEGTILSCREKGFQLLEEQTSYLDNREFEGSYGELWTLRKLLRRFIWHDRIHAKAMYRRAAEIWGREQLPEVFGFGIAFGIKE